MTFFAGNRLAASDLNDLLSKINNNRIPLLDHFGTTGSTAVGTAEAVTTTMPSATFSAHTAYRITFQGLCRMSAIGIMQVNFRDTNIAGTARGGPGGFNVPAANTNYWGNFDHYIANTPSADIDRVLAVTISTSAGTGLFNAAATAPWSFVVTAVGLDTDWGQAVAL